MIVKKRTFTCKQWTKTNTDVWFITSIITTNVLMIQVGLPISLRQDYWKVKSIQNYIKERKI